jgi:hypothetical protein
VHDVRHAGRAREAAQPLHDLAGVGVGRHRVDSLDARGHLHLLAVDLDRLRALEQLAPARAGGRVAHEEHGVAPARSAAFR